MSECDWEEDFSHENGNYECRCCICGRIFIGHKRRATCKVCQNRGYDPIIPKNRVLIDHGMERDDHD